MAQRMTWEEVKKVYPSEWVAFVSYTEKDGFPIEGIVVAHHPERELFHKLLTGLTQYKDIAIRYSGQRIKNPEIPLLWQITGTN